MDILNIYHYFYCGTNSKNTLNHEVINNLQYVQNLIPNEKAVL